MVICSTVIFSLLTFFAWVSSLFLGCRKTWKDSMQRKIEYKMFYDISSNRKNHRSIRLFRMRIRWNSRVPSRRESSRRLEQTLIFYSARIHRKDKEYPLPFHVLCEKRQMSFYNQNNNNHRWAYKSPFLS